MNSRIKSSLVRQHDQHDCGIACLASVIRYHGGHATLDQLRHLSGTSTDGTTLLGLCEAAQKAGFDAEGLEANDAGDLRSLTSPVILHVTIGRSLAHYLVFFAFDNSGGAIIGDPAAGIRTYSQAELNDIWTSRYLLDLKPNQDFIKSSSRKDQKRKWFYSLVKDDVLILIAATFLGVVTSIIGLSTAIFSKKLIDDILPLRDVPKFTMGVILLFILLMAKTALSAIRNQFLITQSIIFNSRTIQSFYQRLLTLPKFFFDTRTLGELVSRMNDTRRIQTSLTVITGSLVIDILLLVVSTVFMFTESPTIGFVALVIYGLHFMILMLFNERIGRAQTMALSSFARSESYYIDTIQGITTIKQFQRESEFDREGRKVYSQFQNEMFSLGRLNIRFSLLSEITGTIFIAGVIAISSWQVLSHSLSVGEVVAILSVASGIVPAIMRIVAVTFQFHESSVALDRTFEFSNAAPEEESIASPIDRPLPDLSGKEILLQATNVAFRFPGRRRILRDVSMELSAGEITALLGESGCGKTTLMNVLQKFYLPESGSVSLNHVDYRDIPMRTWRSSIGVVPQEVKIFNGSLLYNICLSDSQEEYQRALNLCSKFGFNEYFEQFPQGYGTILGEGGITPSGGQKQLLAFARILLLEPRILLLDEPTAAMDRKTEGFIMNLIMSFKKDMAILLVTHKAGIARKADRVLLLEDGVIAGDRQPSELMDSDVLLGERS